MKHGKLKTENRNGREFTTGVSISAFCFLLSAFWP